MSHKKVVSVILANNKRVYLPSNHTYYVYECPVPKPIGVYPHSATWLSLKDYVNDTGFDVRIHGEYGEFLYRDNVYIKVEHGYILIAILSSMYDSIMPDNALSNVFMHLYLVEDDVKKIQVTCAIVNSAADSANIYANSLSATTTVFINGRESTLTSPTVLNINDRVEMITDPAVIGTITISETDPTTYKTFIDSSDSKEKVIIHIPKSINPTNRLLTHNTCDIFIQPTFQTDISASNYNTTRLSGVYINRADTDQYIGQITHNDFYIDTTLLDMYKDKYEFSTIQLKILIRESSKDARLVDERLGIRVLYSLTDEEILDFLAGDGDPTLSRWTANSLANSPYSKTLYSLQKPDVHSDLAIYLEMFGYLGCANIICGKIQRYTVKHYTGHTVCVPIPISLYNATNVSCIIRLNGLLVDPTTYTTEQVLNELIITLDESIELKVGQTLIFELLDSISPRAEYITPSAGSNTLSVSGPIKVYRVRTLGSQDTVDSDLFNSAYTMTSSFELITTGFSIATIDDVETLTFESSMYDITYLVTSASVAGITHRATFSVDSLGGDIISTGLLTTECKKWSDDTVSITIPCLWDTFVPYLNGYELAGPIDYTVVPIMSTTDKLIGRVIHINSIDYLSEADNDLIVLISPDREIAQLNDFSHEQFNESIFTTFMWFNSINMMSASGLAVDSIQKAVDRLGVPCEIPAGSLLHTRISLPEPVITILDEAAVSSGRTSTMDINNALLMTSFLKSKQEKAYKLSVIEKSHNVYSVLTTKIIKEVLDGNTEIIDGNTTALNTYLALQSQDVVLHNNFNTITISRTIYNSALADGMYVLFDTNQKGNDRIWTNSNGCYIIYKGSFWELDTAGGLPLFRSRTVYREYDPWLLIWGALIDSSNPIFESTAIDLRYIDAFPSYRAYDIPATSGYANIYNTLRDVIQTIFPVDGIQAGVTMR